MTKKKYPVHQPSPRELALYRLRLIAFHLREDIPLNETEKIFISDALMKIGEGYDPVAVLGIKARRGEKTDSKSIAKADRLKIVMLWVATAVAPEDEDGCGMDLLDAIDRAAEMWKYEPDTLLTAWRENPDYRRRRMPRPISTLPDYDWLKENKYPK